MFYQGQLETTPHCPHCNQKIDGFTSLEGERGITDGDVSVCAYCKTVLEFENGVFKFVTIEALEEIDLPVLQQANRVVAKLELWKK